MRSAVFASRPRSVFFVRGLTLMLKTSAVFASRLGSVFFSGVCICECEHAAKSLVKENYHTKYFQKIFFPHDTQIDKTCQVSVPLVKENYHTKHFQKIFFPHDTQIDKICQVSLHAIFSVELLSTCEI